MTPSAMRRGVLQAGESVSGASQTEAHTPWRPSKISQSFGATHWLQNHQSRPAGSSQSVESKARSEAAAKAGGATT